VLEKADRLRPPLEQEAVGIRLILCHGFLPWCKDRDFLSDDFLAGSISR
jgi:hypothetical protein